MEIQGTCILDPKVNTSPIIFSKSKHFEMITYTLLDVIDNKVSDHVQQNSFVGRLFAFKDLFFYGFKTATNITLILAFSMKSTELPKEYSVKCVSLLLLLCSNHTLMLLISVTYDYRNLLICWIFIRNHYKDYFLKIRPLRDSLKSSSIFVAILQSFIINLLNKRSLYS